MVTAGASAASSIEGFGIRLRVRGSSVSINPVSRNSPVSPIRHEIPSVGSAIENTTVQPPLWREKNSIGALAGTFEGALRGVDFGGIAPTLFRPPAALSGSGAGLAAPPLSKTPSPLLSGQNPR